MQTDLFGDPYPQTGGFDAKRYAARPGSGPPGETCGSCKHRVLRKSRFWKCGILRGAWTRGNETDIRPTSPACVLWVAGKIATTTDH
jgi:hypothetical protein